VQRDNRYLVLTDEQRVELTKWAQSRTLPAGDVFRARLILALAAGQSYREIASSLQTQPATISFWKRRFLADGIDGLQTRHRGSEPRKVTPALQARILKKTQQAPPDGSTHWSCRKMASIIGVSKATVQRVWTSPAETTPVGKLHGQ
jgi:transposase